MLVVGALLIAAALAASWALRGGNTAVFSILTFAAGVSLYFRLLVEWLGAESVFNGASLEFFGVLPLLALSCGAAAVTAWAATSMMRRRIASRLPSNG